MPPRKQKLPVAILSEKQEERFADRTAEMLGYRVIRFSQPRRTMQTRGICDRIYAHRQHRLLVWAELKSEKGKLSIHQQDFHETLRDCDQLVVSGTANQVGAFLADRVKERIGKR